MNLDLWSETSRTLQSAARSAGRAHDRLESRDDVMWRDRLAARPLLQAARRGRSAGTAPFGLSSYVPGRRCLPFHGARGFEVSRFDIEEVAPGAVRFDTFDNARTPRPLTWPLAFACYTTRLVETRPTAPKPSSGPLCSARDVVVGEIVAARGRARARGVDGAWGTRREASGSPGHGSETDVCRRI